MKFALSKEHHDFFDKQGFIEFEDLISPATAQRLSKSIRHFVGRNIGQLPERLFYTPPAQLFNSSRDLWRKDQEVKKQVINHNLVQIASQLIRQRPIRLALDQWLPAGFELNTGATIEQIIPVQGVSAAAFIALDSSLLPDDSPSFFPKTAGNVLFVKPSLEIPFAELTQGGKQSFLLIVYCGKNSVYIHNPRDPLTHYLKAAGYVYGDRLSDNTHPLFLQ